MAIRVTQHTMYNNMVGHMQSNLGAYMESIQQGSSQKKINRPSDDPAGTYRVLTTRNDMVATEQYQENVDTAKGWLNLADSILSTNVTTAITGLKTLAEQASTGTYTAEQRMIMADQARQYFGQLLNLSNTQFEDMHIFAGHKYDKPAFQQGLAPTTSDAAFGQAVEKGYVTVLGSSERTVLVQFTENGGVLGVGSEYIWSNDGGVTWSDPEKVTPGVNDKGDAVYELKPTGIGVTMQIQTMIPSPELANPDAGYVAPLQINLGAYDPDKLGSSQNGTMLYLRPAALYQGDDKDAPNDVTIMGAGSVKPNRPDSDVDDDGLTDNRVVAQGTFGTNVLVKINGSENKVNGQSIWDQNVGAGQTFEWSYSTDGGQTWITAKGTAPNGGTLRLPLPGGYVDFDMTQFGGTLPAGMQANIHPSRSDLEYEIMKDTYVSVNSVGKDIFGGYYEGKPVLGNDGSTDSNLFEVVGKFIGYLEGNNQDGCQKTLAALETAEKKVLAEATRIGGLENRISMAADVLSFQKIDQQERLSYTEDIDLTELLTKLTRQQLTYQTVLQSSSMIMQLSLAKYV